MRFRPLSTHTRLTLWYTGILLMILILVSVLSYSLLAWNLAQDVDHSLLTVAEVVRDTGASGDPFTPERVLRGMLGAEFFDQFFQIAGPDGTPSIRSPQLPGRQSLPLSRPARTNAARGQPTFETVQLQGPQNVRLITLPVIRHGRLTEIVQVGMSLAQRERTLRRYLQTLLVLVPLGVLLAASGGAITARTALRRVDQMSLAARRITEEGLGRRLQVRGTGDELDRLADTLNGMLARLEATFGEIRRFSADAAHELRTPLTALKGGLEVALRSDRTGEEYRRVLEAALEDVERLGRLAEDLLLLSRANAGADRRRERVDLEQVAMEALDVGVRLAGNRLTVRLAEAVPVTVSGNPVALRRAVVNLIENAVKYTPSGGRVELSVVHADGAAAVTVDDSGPGIVPADAERIFEPFVRLDDARARDTGGSGLGLAIARSIALAHGGDIVVDRGGLGGARFTIRLPLA